eukprot:2833136-Prorocentrum_lima.AAC.1
MHWLPHLELCTVCDQTANEQRDNQWRIMFDEVIEEERARRQAIDRRQEAMNERMDVLMREMLEQSGRRRG